MSCEGEGRSLGRRWGCGSKEDSWRKGKVRMCSLCCKCFGMSTTSIWDPVSTKFLWQLDYSYAFCRISTKSIDTDFATAAGQDASLAGAKGCEAGAGKSPATDDAPMLSQRHSFLAGDLHNERTLRALLHRAKTRLSEQNQAFSVELQNLHVDSGRPEVTADPELARMNAQLMETCSQPKAGEPRCEHTPPPRSPLPSPPPPHHIYYTPASAS